MDPRRFLAVALMVLFAAVVLAACGGGSSSSSSSSPEAAATESEEGTEAEGAESTEAEGAESTEAEGAESEAAAGGELVEAPSETRPTTIPSGLEPLKKPPPKGLNVVVLQCDIPTCAGFTKTFQEIGKNLDWKMKTIVFKTGQPQDAFTEAVNSPGVEYVYISGIPTNIIKPQLKVAAEKGIIVIKGQDPGPAEPPTVPVAISRPEGNDIHQAEGLGRWVINDSKGKAHVVVIGLPEIPVVVPTPETAEKVLGEECPECTVEELPVTGEELAAGTVPAKVIAYLQGHPETNYVWGSFGNLTLGIPEALKTAGLAEKVKVVSMNGIEPAEAKYLKNGEIQAFDVSIQGEYVTMAADAIIRLAQGLPLPQKIYEDTPQSWLCTPKTAEECLEGEPLPPGFLEQYEELWGAK